MRCVCHFNSRTRGKKNSSSQKREQRQKSQLLTRPPRASASPFPNLEKKQRRRDQRRSCDTSSAARFPAPPPNAPVRVLVLYGCVLSASNFTQQPPRSLFDKLPEYQKERLLSDCVTFMRIRDSAPKFCSQSAPKFCTIHLTRRLDWRCPSFAVSFSSYILTRRLDWRCPSFAVSFPHIL